MPRPIRSAVAALGIALLTGSITRAQELAPECAYAPDGPSQISVGVVDCLRFDSAMMGGVEPFSYYIPPACDPALGRRCPVYYFLHGLSGDYRVGLGPKGQATSPWVRALTSGPAADPRTLAEPWLFADPASWVPKPPLDFVLVAPHGPTLPGGHGTGEPKDTGWQDFHPQYWEGGESQVFDGPPPRAASMFTDELIPYVEAHLPVIAGRHGRALGGISYGGIGTGHIGLRRPDLFSSLQMTSGIGLAWPPACVADPGGGEVALPIGPQPLQSLPDPAVQPRIEDAISPPLIFITQNGDGLSTDYGYTRQHHPPDLMINARAFHQGVPVIRLAFTANDSIPHRPADLLDPLTPVWVGLEHLVATETGPMADLESTLRGVPHHFEFNPGTHSSPYWDPYFRVWLEEMYAVVAHADGGGNVYPAPDVFDYRSWFADFTVWGWQVSIERPIDEFINLTDVSCDGLTLRGTGLVTVTVPLACGTGLAGSNVVVVDLGPSTPTNEPAALGLCDSYGNTETVALEPLPDLDADGVLDLVDNCPLVANAEQLDRGGIASAEPDGIGDACQCGDVTGNGIVNGQDGNAIRRHGLDQQPNPLFAVPGNCDVTGNGLCNGQDGQWVRRAGLGFEDPLDVSPRGQNCQNADPDAPPCSNCGL